MAKGEETPGLAGSDGARGEPVDSGIWDKLHRRLEAARKAAEGGFTPAPEKKKKILKARAIALARETGAGVTTGACLEAVEFLLAHEKYAIESVYISEVFPLKEITPLPCTPPFILGIINVRGQILSVMDLKKFFDLPETEPTKLSKIVILHSDEMEFGILADVVLGTRSIPIGEIQPSLPTLTDIRAEYLKGVTNERLVILDAAKILCDKKIVVYEEIDT